MPGRCMLALATFVAVARLGSAAVPLELDVFPARPSFRMKEPVVLRVLVRNPHESTDTRYLKPGFWPVPYSAPMDGDLGLHVSVTDPKGRSLEGSKARMIVVRAQTTPLSFQSLRPGAFVGEEIVLTREEFGFVFEEPGRYAIEVGIGAAPLGWYDAWVKSHSKMNVPTSHERSCSPVRSAPRPLSKSRPRRGSSATGPGAS